MPKWLPLLPKTWVTSGVEQRWLLPNWYRGYWLLFALAAGFRLHLSLAASGCCCCRFRWTVQTRIKRRRGEGKEKRKVRGRGRRREREAATGCWLSSSTLLLLELVSCGVRQLLAGASFAGAAIRLIVVSRWSK
ncbi:hypothetical protein KY285_032460 [Solanum tuberosum]|nr:hypothetical protein KY285_032460 [Solanum tuberosum]